MRRIALIAIILMLANVPAFAMAPNPQKNPSTDSRLKISASFWTLAHFTKKIGGDRVSVVSITPSGAEPHEFEPTARSVQKVYDSGVFIYLDESFDPWAARLDKSLQKSGVSVLSMERAMKSFLDSPRPMRHALVVKDNSAPHASRDPHFWLDPVHAATMASIIRDTLARVDPEGADVYKENASEFIRAIRVLDAAYRKALQPCRTRHVVVSHDAFSYLAKRYNFQVLAITGVSPQQEPTARRLAELVRAMRAKGIGYVLVEPFGSTRAARALASETGAGLFELNPIGALNEKDISTGRTYLSIMRDNLLVLKKAMQCEVHE